MKKTHTFALRRLIFSWGKHFPLVAQTVKNLPAMWENWGLISGSGRSPGEECGNPLQYSCLKNSVDRGTWWATVCGGHRVRHDRVTFTFKHTHTQASIYLHTVVNDVRKPDRHGPRTSQRAD